MVVLKAIACERPTDDRRYQLSRLSIFDVCERVCEIGLTPSYSTLWRRLHQHALRPWLFQQWLFPRDPRLMERATPVLGLYHRQGQGLPLGPRDVVLSADEMSGFQAVSRIHASLPPGAHPAAPLPGRPNRRPDPWARVEFEYERHGTVCYQAFLNVFMGKVYGEVLANNGMKSFERILRYCLKSAL